MGMSIQNSSLFIEVRNLSRYEGQLRNVNKAWQDNTDASGGQGGDQAFFYTWHSATGIPINFEEESGFVTF